MNNNTFIRYLRKLMLMGIIIICRTLPASPLGTTDPWTCSAGSRDKKHYFIIGTTSRYSL